MEKLSILKQFALYNAAEPEFQADLVAAARPAHLEAGALFYQARGTCAAFALVGSGSLRVFRIGETGREITLYHVQAGETCLVNMLSTFLHMPPPASAVAETPVDALLVPAQTFRVWLQSRVLLQTYVFETMAARLVDLMTLVEEIAFRRMDRRLAEFLHRQLVPADERGAALQATHETIAAELGTAREVVSRLLKEFQRRGAIEVGRGRIALRDAAALREFVTDDRPGVPPVPR